MPVFAYRALTAAGRDADGLIDAETTRAAWQALRARGVFPTELTEQTAASARGAGAFSVRRVPAPELGAAIRALATLVAAGVPVAEAVAAVAEEATHPALGRALTVAGARLREGEPLAAALAASPRVFPPLFRGLVAAGEASGALAPVLVRLADHAEASAAVRARLRAALAYPAVVTAATAAVLAFVLAWVVPQVTALFAETGARLPLATRLLVGATDLARATWWLVLPLAAAAAWAFGAWRARPAGRAALDALLLRIPLLGRVARQAAVARLARTLATLVASGVPVEPALGIAADAVGSAPIARAVLAARDAVREGEALAPALARTGAFPPLLVRLAAVGERGGTLAATLERAAVTHEAAVAAAVAAATALVEPALVLAMGGVVLALVAAILLPLFELNGLVR
ncbi:MAG TPA: type II secretion system F family protein [Candidatus Binatia bacterium]|nr:type II secretion system F family protein [Candidatus Binatia bacterium]